ncbi:choline dehydrogenase 7 [Podila epigama]|nr:choline dehydrogenase 7 [Podila epigama]
MDDLSDSDSDTNLDHDTPMEGRNNYIKSDGKSTPGKPWQAPPAPTAITRVNNTKALANAASAASPFNAVVLSNQHGTQPGPAREGSQAPKQTRKATKRADRGRPRVVVPLKTNPDGSLNYPIVVGKGTNEVIIENMGRIVWSGRGYHNHRYIFPVGFRSKKQYTSLSDTSKKTYFISEILDGGEAPIFQITLEDMPEKVFRHSSSSGAWELALRSLMDLGFNAKTHASGPDMYGLTNLGVIKYIQEMPNAHRCRRYMPLKWIIDKDHVDGIPLSEIQAQHAAGANASVATSATTAVSTAVTGAAGKGGNTKSPRKKKINNTIYASNHSSVKKESEASSAATAATTPTMASTAQGSFEDDAHASRAYTPVVQR